MNTDTNTTKQSLGELVTKVPKAAKVLHRYGLDFCCGGKQSLKQACQEKSIEAGQVLAEIDAELEVGTDDETRWDTAHLSQLINHIMQRFHEPLRRELPQLIGLARRTEEVHAAHRDCPRGLADLLVHVHEAVKQHLAKEEQILFPMIMAGHGAQTGGPVKVMFAEHEDHGENLAHIRKLAWNFEAPEDACPTWRSLYLGLQELEHDLMEHIHLENNILFPRALGAKL